MKDLSRGRWRTSSYSGTNSNCVEVAADSGARVLVRDTTDREGPVLAFGPGAWRQFARQVRSARCLPEHDVTPGQRRPSFRLRSSATAEAIPTPAGSTG
jgi:hypothetical protein